MRLLLSAKIERQMVKNYISIFLILSGYGRNENEANMNCIKNFLEFVIEEDINIPLVMRALKKGTNTLILINYIRY